MEKQTLNFDLPPTERWKNIVDNINKSLPKKMAELKEFAAKLVERMGILSTAFNTAANLAKDQFTSTILHREELTFWSEILDISLPDIVLLQLMYEMAAACTTVITKDFFFRTMDWSLPELKNFTYQLDLVKDGKKIGTAVTWLGYIGLLTVFTDKYSLAVNYRKGDGNYLNLFKRLIGKHWPVGYLVREIVEKQLNPLEALTSVPLITGCYFTLYSQKSYIITRSHDAVDDIISSTSDDRLICTNCDRTKTEPNILCSLERRKLVKDLPLKDWNELLVAPVINSATIYYTVQEKDGLTIKLVY